MLFTERFESGRGVASESVNGVLWRCHGLLKLISSVNVVVFARCYRCTSVQPTSASCPTVDHVILFTK